MRRRCKDDLIRKLQSHPLPFEQVALLPPMLGCMGSQHRQDVHCKGYPGLAEDIKDLQGEGTLHVLSESQGVMVLHYLNPSSGLEVDDDIKALWHKHQGSCKRPRSLLT
jgi:hypothetical protein